MGCITVLSLLFFVPQVFSEDIRGAIDAKKENSSTWQLSNGIKFSVWTSSQNKSNATVSIWSDLRGYSIQYKIAGPGSSNDWQSFEKLSDTKTGEAVLGAKATLPRGRFIIGVRVEVSTGRFEEFDSLFLNVE